MRIRVRKRLLRYWGFRHRQEGGTAVEFALLFSALIMVLGGIVDFGHGWYLRQVITEASREGARYGVIAPADSTAMPVPRSTLNPSIHDYVMNNYLTGLVDSANPQVPTPTGAGYASGLRGDPLTVTVTATKTWFILGIFIPYFNTPSVLTATTTMLLE